jgi:hypothetical protein
MSTTATLVYSVVAVGPTVPANLEAAVAAVSLAQQEADFETVTGATLTSDTTTLVGVTVTRTIVFGITSAQFVQQFPAGTDQGAPFRGLFQQAIGGGVASPVKEVLTLT